MRLMVALDTGPLGILTHPQPSEMRAACRAWMNSLLDQGIRVVLPDVADFELRCEYERRNNRSSLRQLDSLAETLDYLPIDTNALRRAATLWAQLRKKGQPTAHSKALDADCVLVAQIQIDAEKRGLGEDEWIIATSDVGDLSRLAPAARWNEISRF